MLAEVEQKIDLRNLDKSDWKSYRFDEIAHNISERIDPNNTDLEIYIGLEHIDSESIHIKRFGTRDDVNGQKLRFYPGDVIFGRRRAYQRKAAIAETDGFCSAHALVLRANPDVIDPKLFPFFLHSDAFMHRAVDISVGSLSPTINWGTLKKQEFLMPPIEKQEKLAELFLNLDLEYQAKNNLLEKVSVLKNSTMRSIFSFHQATDGKESFETEIGYVPKGWKIVEQGDVAEFINGRAYKKSEWEKAGVPVIRLQNLTGTGDDYYYSNLTLPEKNYCIDGDLLYMWSATFGAKIWNGERAIFHYHIWKIECDESVLLKHFMFYNLEEITRRMMRQVSGSTMAHITKNGMEKLKIALPPISEQSEYVSKLKKLDDGLDYIQGNLSSIKELSKSLQSQVF